VILQKGVVGDSTDPNAYPGDITSVFVNVSATANGQPNEVVVPGFVPNVSHAYLIWSPVNKNATAPGIGVQYGVLDVGVAVHDGDVLSPILDGSIPSEASLVNATFTTVSTHSAWYNSARPFDVNDSNAVSPLDALIIINELNSVGAHTLGSGDALPTAGAGFYWDVNNDGIVNAADAQAVIDSINGVSAAPALVLTEDSFGHYSITQAPEPASIALLLAGGGLLLARRRRRSNVH
jgi:hypothetical protein